MNAHRQAPVSRHAAFGGFARVIATLLTAVLPAVASIGCASLPESVQRPASHAMVDVSTTRLASVAASAMAPEAASEVDPQAISGVRLLPSGEQAFEARIALARAAQKTIDAQYYLIAADTTGLQFLRELRDAAARGVRVRLLVDDLYAVDQDDLFTGLAEHDNVEVRLFNPLPVREGSFASRIVFSLHDFSRINRRMHNKLFVVDNTFAIAGGRNIADEYFGRAQPANFIDMDVLISGAAVREMSSAFDGYWNSDYVYPVASLMPARASARPMSSASSVSREEFDALVAAAPVFDAAALTASRDALGQSSVGSQIDAGRIEMHAARVRVLADAPSKVAARDRADGEVAQAHLEMIGTARSEVMIASPYFVPGQSGIAALQKAVDNQVSLSVMTNSLATTDEPLVHYGYARYRLGLLKMGAALYELKPAGADERRSDEAEREIGRGSYGPHGSLGRLHAKLAVADRRQLFIGSMNMDQRSAHSNTELGLIIESPAVAVQVTDLLQRERLPASYRVAANVDGSVHWTDVQRGTAKADFESKALSSMTRLRLWLMSAMVDEGLL